MTFNAVLFGLPVVGEVDLGPMSVTLTGDFSAATSPAVVLRNALLGRPLGEEAQRPLPLLSRRTPPCTRTSG